MDNNESNAVALHAPEKILVLVSGGLDSTVLLAEAISVVGAQNVVALGMTYGQVHEKEKESAKAVCAHYGVELIELDMSSVFESVSCPLLKNSEEAMPEGDYAEQERDANGVVKTYVPFRNGLFLSAAASIAYGKGCDTIAYGAHADDSAGNAYPDCTIRFVNCMSMAIVEGTAGAVGVVAPFIKVNKAEIVRVGLENGSPLELTWSCYEGGDVPCGKCGTCIDRAKAFEANKAQDPALK